MNILAILGIIRPCFYFLFLWKMTFSNPPTPLKYGKFHTFLFFIFDAFPYYTSFYGHFFRNKGLHFISVIYLHHAKNQALFLALSLWRRKIYLCVDLFYLDVRAFHVSCFRHCTSSQFCGRIKVITLFFLVTHPSLELLHSFKEKKVILSLSKLN